MMRPQSFDWIWRRGVQGAEDASAHSPSGNLAIPLAQNYALTYYLLLPRSSTSFEVPQFFLTRSENILLFLVADKALQLFDKLPLLLAACFLKLE